MIRITILVGLILAQSTATTSTSERWDVGLATSGVRVEALAVPAAPTLPTVLLIGGLRGSDETVERIRAEVAALEKLSQARRQFRLIAIPLANPDGNTLVFPPTGVAYRENSESHVLWRWIAAHAPDLVIVAGNEDFGLADALSKNVVAGVGRIPAQRATGQGALLGALPRVIPLSEARQEMDRRRSRTPRQVADELAQVYGKDFDQPTYLPGMALIGRMRLGHLADVERIVAPYINGTKDPLARPGSTNLAGHLVFAELGERTKNAAYVDRLIKVANLGFTETGEMKESMPYHDEMSDSVFMAIPILAKAGKLTGERKYFDMGARHLTFMQKLVLRPDGLYRHSPLTEAAWGRGNAFPALGLALALSDFPKDHPEFRRMLDAFQKHIVMLAQFQNEDGLWREVVDHPGAYAEYSATAMIGTAILRGIRNGWLDARTYQPRVDKAWTAILARTGSDGKLIDVCESTGKQRSLKDYLNRAAILDRDPRGGGMALIFATEMAGLP